jgi:hypothetical protein
MRRGDACRARAPGIVSVVIWFLVSFLLAIGIARQAWAEPLRTLGRFERESVDEALALLGLAIDPKPDGKIIGQVHVVNQDVFSRRDWRLQIFNIFHRTSRSDVIARELLLGPGQPWDEALADESVRNLQAPPPLFFADDSLFAAPALSSVVAVLPVVSPLPGTVDLLAVTRDLWSLRFNTQFQFQKNALTLLQTSLSENNLLGWRKYLAAEFRLDQGRYGLGPTYFDPNLLGTRLTLLANGIAWYARDSGRYEGNSEVFSLRYPLYSLASRWGAGVDVIHQDVVNRHFCDNELCLVDVGGAPTPFIYQNRTVTVDANAMRSFGQTAIQRLTAGYRFDRRQSAALSGPQPEFGDPAFASAFLAAWAPLPETRSEPYLRYQVFTPRYRTFRDFDTFDLRETRRLGPSLSAEVAAGLPALGADFVAYPMNVTASWAAALAGSGFGLAQVQSGARARSGQLIDRRLSAVLYVASPLLARAVRVVAAAMTDAVRADRYQTRFFLGGDTGLRGYQIGEFQGQVQAAGHVELRSAPLDVYSQRFGAVLFYDVGHAASSYGALVPHHDLGIGLRWLIPQLNSSVFRLDWAVPTQDGPYTRAGFPGRIVAGFMQSFWLLDSPKGYLPMY